MGIVIDSSVIIAAERKGLPADIVLERLRRSAKAEVEVEVLLRRCNSKGRRILSR